MSTNSPFPGLMLFLPGKLGTYFKIRINETQSGHTKEKQIVGATAQIGSIFF
jgi:hypothetical protein